MYSGPRLVALRQIKSKCKAVIGYRYWWLSPVTIAGLIQFAVTFRALRRPAPLVLDVDAALFQHAGWYILQGAIPYVHIWDPTPPLAFFIPLLLTLFTGGDVLTLHVLSLLLTGLVAVLTVLLIALLIASLTADRLAGILGGLLMYTFVYYYNHATLGFGFKHFTLFFGLLGLWLALRRHPFLSGMAVAASALIWLPSAIFILLGLGMVYTGCGRRQSLLAAAGISLTAAVVLAPIAYWEALQLMLGQMFAPLVVSEDLAFIMRFKKAAYFLEVGALFLIAAVFMVVQIFTRRQWHLWWVVAGTSYFTVQILFLDFDNFPDLYSIMAFSSVLFGLFVARTSGQTRHVLAVCVLATILIAPLVHYGLGMSDPNAEIPETRVVEGRVVPSMQTIYWQKIKPETCHYRLSGIEQAWLASMKARGVDVSCDGAGHLP